MNPEYIGITDFWLREQALRMLSVFETHNRKPTSARRSWSRTRIDGGRLSRSTVRRSMPTTMRSRCLSRVGFRTRTPPANVPFLDPISAITQCAPSRDYHALKKKFRIL